MVPTLGIDSGRGHDSGFWDATKVIIFFFLTWVLIAETWTIGENSANCTYAGALFYAFYSSIKSF